MPLLAYKFSLWRAVNEQLPYLALAVGLHYNFSHIVLYCLYFRLFRNMDDKTFTLYDTILQKVRVETQIEIIITKIWYD